MNLEFEAGGRKWRIRTYDGLNITVDEWRSPLQNGKAKGEAPKWMNCGRYYQRLDGALLYVYDRCTGESIGDLDDLRDAVGACAGVRSELVKAVRDMQ